MTPILRLALLSPLVVLTAAQSATGTDRVFCIFGDAARPVACLLTDTATRRGHHMVFRAGRQRAVFDGRRNSAWWSGQLNGRPAMGYEVNRGHIVFSSTDLQNRFEWWYPGSRVGE